MGTWNAPKRAPSPRAGKPAEKSAQPSGRAEFKLPDGRYLNDDNAQTAGMEYDLRDETPTGKAHLGPEFDRLTKKISPGAGKPTTRRLQPTLILTTGTAASAAVGYGSFEAYAGQHTAPTASTTVVGNSTASLPAPRGAEGDSQNHLPELGLGLAVAMFVGTLWLLSHTRSPK
uniref:hypothetical protein n=1 Tax=Actinoplanes sp. CA-151224 TaxID=3239904 RepID=UPI003F492EAD